MIKRFLERSNSRFANSQSELTRHNETWSRPLDTYQGAIRSKITITFQWRIFLCLEEGILRDASITKVASLLTKLHHWNPLHEWRQILQNYLYNMIFAFNFPVSNPMWKDHFQHLDIKLHQSRSTRFMWSTNLIHQLIATK